MGNSSKIAMEVHQQLKSKKDNSIEGRTFSAVDLMAEDLPPIKWIVPDILPEGVTILAGKPKLGKSWMALGITIAIASGGVALGTKPVEQGSCLYLALEDNKRRLQRRMRKLLGGSEVPLGLILSIEWSRLDNGGVEEIEEWIEAHPDARLIVIDTLKKVRPRSNSMRSVYDLDYEALEPLVAVAGRYGVAILVVHHTRKLLADDPMDEISGSTGLTGGVDGALVLKRDRGKADAYLHVSGRDIEEDAEYALTWDHNVASWTLAGDADDYRRAENPRKIIRVLEEAGGGPLGPKELSELAEIDYDTTRNALTRMVKEGSIENPSRGKYTTVAHNAHIAHNATDTHNAHSPHLATIVSMPLGDAHNPTAQSPIYEANPDNVSNVSNVSTRSRRLTEEEAQKVQKLINKGSKPAEARAEVLGERH